MTKTSFVYLIRCESPKPLYKIGFATDPVKRLSELQTGCPFDLTLIMQYPGDSQEEGRLHRTMGHHSTHIRGEWYDLDSKDLEFLDVCKNQGSSRYVLRIAP